MSSLSTFPFVHLRIHSEFSVVDGSVRIDELIKQSITYQQPAVALTDLSNLFGLVKFYKSARSKGVKPIAGADVWISPQAHQDKASRLLLLVKNHQGYLNLCELLTKAYLENQIMGKPHLKAEWFNQYAEGLFALSGAREGSVGHALANGNIEQAVSEAQAWATYFPNSFFIELQRAGRDGDETYVQGALAVAQQLQLPVVATHPVQFLNPEDFAAHEVRVCIASGETLANPKRKKEFTEEQYLLSSEQMFQKFSDIPSALENPHRIAQACNLTLELGKAKLPLFPTPDGVSLEEFLIQLANQGLQKRMPMLFPDPELRLSKMAEYQARLDLECKTINDMGFPGYFLIVQDFINWGKANNVPVGPGRGSGAGSLVAFSLGITDIDPIRYDLLFERFLNPERVSMPDFDIDFCQDKRGDVIEYVKREYGREAVSQIATFGTLGAKAVVRDVGRVLNMPYSLCDTLSKLIPHNPADPWSLERALKEEPTFAERYETDEEVKALIDLAKPLEGLTRNIGMHAGGVLIAPGKLTDFCPLYCQPDQYDHMVSQYDKDDVEAVGLVKFDFLGLRNLTILDKAVKNVRRFNPRLHDFDIMSLPLDDIASYRLLSDANTTAVFQLESRGMKELLKKLRPSNFEDIIAVLALYRPGPLGSGMVDDFVNRKHGRAKAEYFTPALEPVLKSTYGVIVYQEQVMLISQIIGGYTLGGADMLRRAMGKKKPEEMAAHREIFEKGAVDKGYDSELAITLFNLMEKFAEYGFNKSHTAAYALIAYQTAWLKAHHPAEFMAATLSSDMDDTDKVQIFYADTVDNLITVLAPDINHSCLDFEPVNDAWTQRGEPPRTIRYGLGAVKGVGHGAVLEIIRARTERPFTDLFDFCSRVNRQTVNRRTIDALIKAGAFDELCPHRAALLASVPLAVDAADQQDRDKDQNSLFGDSHDASLGGELVDVEPWDMKQRLTQEKTALGFFLSGHLFDAYKSEVYQFLQRPLAKAQPGHHVQWLAGVVVSVRTMMTRRGKMLFATLDDGTAQLEVSIFNELFEQHKLKIKEDELLVVQAKLSNDEYSGGIKVVAESIYDLVEAQAAHLRYMRLTVNEHFDVLWFKKMISEYKQDPRDEALGVPLEIVYQGKESVCTLRLGMQWRLRVETAWVHAVQQQYSLEFIYRD